MPLSPTPAVGRVNDPTATPSLPPVPASSGPTTPNNSGLVVTGNTAIAVPANPTATSLAAPATTAADPNRPPWFASNDVLSRLRTTGAGQQTARQDRLSVLGVDASRAMARTDARRVSRYADAIARAAEAHGLPPALLAGLISRESRGGAVLRESGFSRFREPGEGEYGLCQIDPRAHDDPTRHPPTSDEHIDQAAAILRDYVDQVARKHPSWTPAQKLRGAVAAYNFGVDAVRTLAGVDEGTTGGDYSADIWARGQYYAENP